MASFSDQVSRLSEFGQRNLLFSINGKFCELTLASGPYHKYWYVLTHVRSTIRVDLTLAGYFWTTVNSFHYYNALPQYLLLFVHQLVVLMFLL